MISEWIRRLRFTGIGEKKTRQLAGVAIGTEAFILFFGALVAWGINHANHSGHPGLYLTVGLILSFLCLYSSASMRKPIGIPLGWALQVLTLLTAFVVPMMAIAAVIFFALWITALVQGDKMDELTRNYVRDHP